MRAIAILGTAACMCLIGATASTARDAVSPQRLYLMLLATPFPDSQLPQGFSSARVSLAKPSNNAQLDHTVGEARVVVVGPGHAPDGIVYEVFPTAVDARAQLSHPDSSGGHIRVIGKVPSYSLPSLWLVSSITNRNAVGKTLIYSATIMEVAKGNVMTIALVNSPSHQKSGDTPATLALLRAAQHHLALVKAKT
jgi:hypothetical protein